jgi:hypothetical protein
MIKKKTEGDIPIKKLTLEKLLEHSFNSCAYYSLSYEGRKKGIVAKLIKKESGGQDDGAIKPAHKVLFMRKGSRNFKELPGRLYHLRAVSDGEETGKG